VRNAGAIPAAGHRRKDLVSNPQLRFWACGRFFIVYHKIPSGIEVIAILHSARDIPSILDQRPEGQRREK
jgi:plasmid stabilization system protein ParE